MRKLIFDVFVLTYFSLSTLFHCAYAQEAKSAEPDKNQTGAQVGTPTDQTTAPVPKINGTLSSENRPASILDVAACAPNYPAEAVKNEWEGRVVIGFSIDSAGFVTDSKI